MKIWRKCLLSFYGIIFLISYVTSYEIDIDQFNLCYNTKPKERLGCAKRDNSTMICCFLSLTAPQIGDSCLPMTTVNRNTVRNFTKSDIMGVAFTGHIDCNRKTAILG